MKKLFIILIGIIGFGSVIKGQDIILKKDATEIRAKVLEITDQQIKYKDFDFQSGPTRNVNVSEVFMITYENGQKEAFNKQTDPWTTQENSSEYNFFKSLNDREMSNFLENRDVNCYNTFHKGEHLKRAGIGLLIPGLALSVAGIVLVSVGADYYGYSYYYGAYYDDDLYSMYLAGLVLLPIGQTMVIASIPLMAVGGGLKAKGKNMYEEKYFKGKTSSLNLNVFPNGLGLSLKF